MADRSPSMRGHAAATGMASVGSTSGTISSAVSHLPQAHRRLPPAGICAVRPHLQRTVTSSLFMKLLGGKRDQAQHHREPGEVGASSPEWGACNYGTRCSGRGHLFSSSEQGRNPFAHSCNRRPRLAASPGLKPLAWSEVFTLARIWVRTLYGIARMLVSIACNTSSGDSRAITLARYSQR